MYHPPIASAVNYMHPTSHVRDKSCFWVSLMKAEDRLHETSRAEVGTGLGKPGLSAVCCVLRCWCTGLNHVDGVGGPSWWIHKVQCEQTVGSVSSCSSEVCVQHLVSSSCHRLYVNVDAHSVCLLSIFLFFIYAWLSMISCRSLRITDWQGFLVHWHIMTLQLLHRRGGGTFGQTEREAGMKQKLLIQVRIDLLCNHQN